MYEVTKQELSRIAYVMMLVAEYMEPLIDTEDGENGWPVPNKEMRIASMVDEIHTDMENILKRKDDKVIIQPPTGPCFADWSTAPKEATHHAINPSGLGCWWKGEPKTCGDQWCQSSTAWPIRVSKHYKSLANWTKTLEKRPDQEP